MKLTRKLVWLLLLVTSQSWAITPNDRFLDKIQNLSGGNFLTVPAGGTSDTLATLTGTQTFGSGSTWNGGVIAVAYTTVGTQALTESAGAVTINWANGSLFTIALNANLTISFSNQTSGQNIVVDILNTASNYTVTWPGTVKWPSQTAPVETVGAFSDEITCVYNGSNTKCNSVQNF